MIKKKATRADIKDFSDWLEDQTGWYNPQDSSNCLVCQYLKARGIKYPHFDGPDVVRYTHGQHDNLVMLPKTIAEIAYGKNNIDLVSSDFEYTFEAARKRAHSVLKSMR